MCRCILRYVCAVLVIACVTPAWPFIQERVPSNLPVRWNLSASQPNVVAGRVVYIINKRGSEDVDFASLTAAVDSAFSAWKLMNGSVIDFTRNSDPSTAPEGTRPHGLDRRNVVYWDEDPRNGSMIPPLTVSATLRTFDPTTAEIVDSDIVLNGAQFTWTIKSGDDFTSKTGPADIQEAVARGVGQLLGLNTVPTRGGIMQAYTYPGFRGPIALGSDDLAAVLDIYPPTPNPPVTSISGQVTRGGSPVFGAYVAAFQSGKPVVGAVTNMSGNYAIRRVPTGSPTYVVRVLTAAPPLTDPNSFYRSTDNDFLSLVRLNSSTDPPSSGMVTVVPGADSAGINFSVLQANSVDPWESDNTPGTATTLPIGVRQVHHTHVAGDVDYVTFTPVAGRAYLVETDNLGIGASQSDTTILMETGSCAPCGNDDRNPKQGSKTSRLPFIASSSTPHIVRVAQKVSSTAGSGTAYDIMVSEIGTTPLPVPTATQMDPQDGPQAGGYQVTVLGSNFLPGASVLFGSVAGTEVDVVDSNRLFVTVPAAVMGGPVSVTVANMGGGASVPLANGFSYIPEVTYSFSNVTASKVGSTGDGRAAAWIDYDMDGDLDLYLTITGVPAPAVANTLLRNDGDGPFSDVSMSSMLAAPSGPTGPKNWVSAAWGDFDNDGCPDVYLVIFIVSPERVLLKNNCSTGVFQNVTTAAGVAGRSNGRSRDAAWADYDNDGYLDLFVAYDDLAGPNQLFHNQGNGTFADVAATAGVDNVGSAFNANWADFNNDKLMDLFVVRGGTMSDILYRNDGNGHFTDVTAGMGIIDTPQGRDAVWGDLNNDKFIDLYVVGATGINHVFLNNGGMGFSDASTPPTFANAGATNGATQAAAIGDIDNDGDLDLVVAQSLLGSSRQDYVLRNMGGNPLTFMEMSLGDNVDANACTLGDYSGDGALDLFVAGVGANSNILWENGANRNDWLVVQLVGTDSNRMGIGARIEVTADLDGDGGNDPVIQVRQLLGGSKGQGPLEIPIGLGRASVENKKVDSLKVFWPRTDTPQTFTDLAVNQVITIHEGLLAVVVSRVTPSSGTTAGGTAVTISGDNFDSDATVTFDGIPATSITVVDRRTITAMTPSHGAGLADVTVKNTSRPTGDPLLQGTLSKGFLYFVGDPLDSLLIYDSVNTTATWANVMGAQAYDLIRGNIASVTESGGQIMLGTVTCIENDSTDTTTAPNHRDSATPAIGTGFFYLLRVAGGTYGVGTSGSQRAPGSGACP